MILNETILILSLISPLSNPAEFVANRHKVYNENCLCKYELVSNFCSAAIIDLESRCVIESFSMDDNPYSDVQSDYYIYVENREYGYKHMAVVNDELFDLDNNEAVTSAASVGLDIHDSLEAVSFSNIPSTATFCDYSYYFRSLTDNGFGNNTLGTCCLVSMQILFGYYDSVYTDAVIEECYDDEKSSSVTLCSNFSESPSSKGDAFHNYLMNLCDDYLNMKIENGGGMMVGQQNRLINFYIGSVRNLNYGNNTSEGNWSDIFSGRQFGVVSDAIKGGRPVILNNLSHSMVAFAYDNDFVYLMSGWRGRERIAKMKWNDFNGNIFTNAFCGAYDLKLTCGHSCSDNYYSTTLSRFLCPFEEEN